MANYPSPPIIGQKIGANLCPRPAFNDTAPGGWSGYSSITFNATANANRMLVSANATAKITLTGLPVTPADFKMAVRYSSGGGASIGVRPVGSSRVVASNLPNTSGAHGWTNPVDSIIAGDTGSAVELYVKAGANSVAIVNVRVDYVDGASPPGGTAASYYFDGATIDTVDYDYGWDGAAFNSLTSAIAKTGTAGDTTPPPVPTNVRQIGLGDPALNDAHHVTIAWDPVTDPSAPVKYRVWEGLSLQNEDTPAPITATQWTAYTPAGAPAEDTHNHILHRYAVSAVDAKGNESAKSVKVEPQNDNPPNSPAASDKDPGTELISLTPFTADIGWPPGEDDHTVAGYWIWVEPEGQAPYKVNQTIIPPDTLSYHITGLTPNTFYQIYIRTQDDIGQLSAGNNPRIKIITADNRNLPPTTPTGLRVASLGETNVVLAWNLAFDPDDPDTRPYYVIFENGEIAKDKDGNSIGEVGGAAGGTTPATTKNLANLADGSTHTYTVCARDASAVLSEPSEPLTVTLVGGTPPPPDTPPTTPGGLAVADITDTTIGLVWDPSTDDVGVVGYYVYQDGIRVSGGSPVIDTAYTATSLALGTQYSYRVRAVDTIGQTSALSGAATATTTGTPPPPDQPPSAPGGVVVTGVTDTTIGLAWDPSTDDVAVAGYRVYRGGTLISLTITETTYTATGLAPGTQYTLTVKAVDSIGQLSPASAAVTPTTTGAAPPVDAPTGLHTTAVTDNTVALAWDAGTGVAGYHVYRGGTKLTTTPVTETTYTATGLAPGTAYTFTTKAVGSAGQLSPASDPVTTTTTGTTLPPDEPPPVSINGQTVAAFLQQADNEALAAEADPLAATVTLLARGYTRGVGFTSGQPNEEIGAVITMATARLAAHPEQIPVWIGSTHWPAGGFNGWTLAELYVLNRYRKRGA